MNIAFIGPKETMPVEPLYSSEVHIYRMDETYSIRSIMGHKYDPDIRIVYTVGGQDYYGSFGLVFASRTFLIKKEIPMLVSENDLRVRIFEDYVRPTHVTR